MTTHSCGGDPPERAATNDAGKASTKTAMTSTNVLPSAIADEK